MNIFFREVKANFRSLLIWGFIVALFTAMGFSKFTAYEGNPELLSVLDGMPPALLTAFNFKAFNLTTITGFYGVMITYFALILSIAAAMWGSDIISKEERDKTVEFALTLPVTRSRVITAKTLAALVNCVGLLLITWAAILGAASQFQTNSEFYDFVTLSMVPFLILEITFLAVGIFLGSAMKQYKRDSGIAVALLLGTFLLSIISDLNKNLEFLKYLSPFKYFNPGILLHEARIEPVYVVISAGIILVCMLGSYLTYTRRDLYI